MKSDPGGGETPSRGIGLVLGAGGFRGVAHAGVLKALQKESIPVRFLIGASIGGLVAAFHAALGESPDKIAETLGRMRTSTLLSLGLTLRSWIPLPRSFRKRGDPFLRELARLQDADWNRLHFGIEKIGLLALDLKGGVEVFSVTGETGDLSLYEMALGGASIPGLFPPCRAGSGIHRPWLVDGGLSHSVPVERALLSPFKPCRVLAIDLQVLRGFREREADRWEALHRKYPDRIRRVLPRVARTGAIHYRKGQDQALFQSGAEALTPEILAWLRAPIHTGAPDMGGEDLDRFPGPVLG